MNKYKIEIYNKKTKIIEDKYLSDSLRYIAGYISANWESKLDDTWGDLELNFYINEKLQEANDLQNGDYKYVVMRGSY